MTAGIKYITLIIAVARGKKVILPLVASDKWQDDFTKIQFPIKRSAFDGKLDFFTTRLRM